MDTHIWLWLVGEPARLRKRTLAELESSDNQLWLSPISTWEALMLLAKGRVDFGKDMNEWLSAATAATYEAPLTHDIASAAVKFRMHKDPADRFLLATAYVLNMTLVTADEKLLGLGVVPTLGNR